LKTKSTVGLMPSFMGTSERRGTREGRRRFKWNAQKRRFRAKLAEDRYGIRERWIFRFWENTNYIPSVYFVNYVRNLSSFHFFVALVNSVRNILNLPSE
jgi:hypothetical protein